LKISKEDYFNPCRIDRPRKTILNSDIACLKRCEELLNKMKEKGKILFEDPDFGPKSKDDPAVDSIYFGDRPDGYPKSEEMIWLRPNQIS